MEKKLFARTSDPASAEALRKNGFPELQKEGQFFVFLNTGKPLLTFDTSKIRYTNTMFMA